MHNIGYILDLFIQVNTEYILTLDEHHTHLLLSVGVKVEVLQKIRLHFGQLGNFYEAVPLNLLQE